MNYIILFICFIFSSFSYSQNIGSGTIGDGSRIGGGEGSIGGGAGQSSLSVKYFDVIIFNEQIDATLKEHERQKEMANLQTTNTATEVANDSFWKNWKNTYTTIQNRLRDFDFALQSIPTGYVFYLELNEIKNIQETIYVELIGKNLSLLPPKNMDKRGKIMFETLLEMRKIFLSQKDFVKQATDVGLLMSGIVLSYGTINQMEKADRQILLDYALEEVKELKYKASQTLWTIREMKAKALRRRNLLNFYINKDKQIFETFKKNIESL